MEVMQGEAGAFTWPESEPINLDGEADAYTDELAENAYRRLFYVGCQCGFMTTQSRDCCVVTIWTGPGYRLNFDESTWRLVSIERRGAEANWRIVWRAKSQGGAL